MDKQRRKLSEQTEAGETRGKSLEKQVGELSKVISDRTSGAMETKGQTMEMGVPEIGIGAYSRNSREVPKSENGTMCKNTKAQIRYQNPVAKIGYRI